MKLVTMLSSAVLIFVLSSTATARLGETLEECIRRYGKPNSGPTENKIDPSAQDYRFVLPKGHSLENLRTIDSEIELTVTFYKDKAAHVVYKRTDGEKLSRTLEAFLVAEGGGNSLKPLDSERPFRRLSAYGGGVRAYLDGGLAQENSTYFEVWTSDWQPKYMEYEKRNQ